ncbi:hypothetical protein IU453_26830 [Nocardia cyriacigeorgica]|uniref:hypothetical protein n=1 Tax=Nocardia cyriacigeorgica TaxID=135487 RepID=UPI00189424E0|nr:hypothetical protein [Nocardia cyriacigeorgica]MBF6320372.1 hypothetical protein [Nocardia cyriacigeorgica]MBF6534142.1 hypothetical protein [Nocardia cyriacigeorgica]
MESFLRAASAAGGVVTLVTVPLIYVLALTAVFGRDQAQRLAARRVLAVLWPFGR